MLAAVPSGADQLDELEPVRPIWAGAKFEATFHIPSN